MSRQETTLKPRGDKSELAAVVRLLPPGVATSLN